MRCPPTRLTNTTTSRNFTPAFGRAMTGSYAKWAYIRPARSSLNENFQVALGLKIIFIRFQDCRLNKPQF